MNNLITDVKSLEIETLKNLKNSKAHNTLRAYQADFKDFTEFCTKNGFNSLPTAIAGKICPPVFAADTKIFIRLY